METIDAILSEIAEQGYVIVPREPTEAMIAAGQATDCVHGDMNCGAENAYLAMIEAANPPTPAE
jgi:hypothetical protein